MKPSKIAHWISSRPRRGLVSFIAGLSAICGFATAQEPGPKPAGAPASQTRSKLVARPLEELGPGFPFEMTGSDHFYVEVKLNGKGPYRLIFDLGAPVTLLSVKSAKESESLNRDGKKSRGMTGVEGLVKQMQFGDSVAHDIPVMVFDHPAITTMSKVLGKRFDGILGYTFFARYRTTIDYQKKRLWFEPVREKTDDIGAALSDRMMNPMAKGPTKVVIARNSAIGIRVETSKPEAGKPGPPICRVVEVSANSPAQAAGLKPGDVIVALGAYWLFSPADLAAALSSVDPGQEIKAIVERKGQTIEMVVRPQPVF